MRFPSASLREILKYSPRNAIVTSEWLIVQPSASASAPDSALESSLQRTIHSSLVPLNSARTVVVPLPTAVMVPLEDTVATDAFSLVNVTCAPSGRLLTISGACSPG